MERDFEHRMTQCETRLVEVEKRQDNLDELIGTVKVLADREERVEDDVKEIKADVKELTNKPAKRWDDLVTKVILTIVAAVVGFFLAKFGM
jgi:hypothetical protein